MIQFWLLKQKKDLQCTLNKVIEKSESLGLSTNSEKIYSMIVSKMKYPLICKFTAIGIGIKQVEKFNYLASFLTLNGKSDCEIKRRIALSKATFKKKRPILISSNVTVSKKHNLEMLYLLYGCETWSISSGMKKRLVATEVWFIRTMLKFSWINKISHERVLTIANLKCGILQTIKKGKWRF